MELTRRDVVAALAATGVTAGSGAAVLHSRRETRQRTGGQAAGTPLSEHELTTLVAVAGVLYPSEVGNVEGFVTGFLRGRAEDRPDYVEEIAAAVQYLDEYCESWYGERYTALDARRRDAVLREMGADTADPVPDGSDVERVRYYVVNELLFALYTTPTGGELVGIENPQGHPGGLSSYQRGPRS